MPKSTQALETAQCSNSEVELVEGDIDRDQLDLLESASDTMNLLESELTSTCKLLVQPQALWAPPGPRSSWSPPRLQPESHDVATHEIHEMHEGHHGIDVRWPDHQIRVIILDDFCTPP